MLILFYTVDMIPVHDFNILIHANEDRQKIAWNNS